MATPEIVCLTGSTRFKTEFERVAKKLALHGYVVLTVHYFQHLEQPLTEAQKLMLADVQMRQINMCNTLYVINPGGYIGEATRSEIKYATEHGKYISYMERR